MKSQNKKRILQQLSISLFILLNCCSNFSQMKSYYNSSLNKKIVSDSAPFFNLSFFPFSHFLQPFLLCWSYDLGLMWSADLGLGWSSISVWVERRSRPSVECRSRPGVELDLGFTIWLDFGWFLVSFTGRLEWVDRFRRWVFWVVGFWVDFGRRVIDWWWFLLILDEGCRSGGLRREA